MGNEQHKKTNNNLKCWARTRRDDSPRVVVVVVVVVLLVLLLVVLHEHHNYVKRSCAAEKTIEGVERNESFTKFVFLCVYVCCCLFKIRKTNKIKDNKN